MKENITKDMTAYVPKNSLKQFAPKILKWEKRKGLEGQANKILGAKGVLSQQNKQIQLTSAVIP